MSQTLSGIRVLEVASWTFVPAAGAILADWGADVIKVEHPVSGDPQRGLISSGLVPAAAGGFNYMIEQPNRGKRSVGINLAHADGREIHDDAQVIANGYLPTVASDDGSPVALVANPVQFDETPPVLGRAPEHGQHTEEVLLEIGLTWDELAGHKESGAIL